jgi:hypothetical protein
MGKLDLKIRGPQKGTDARRLRRLLQHHDFHLNDSPHIFGGPTYWTLADDSVRGVVGAIQIYSGTPVGIAEPLVLDHELLTRKRHLAQVAEALVTRAMALLASEGSIYIQCMVPEGLASYAKVLENRGAVKCQTGTTLLKKVAPDGRQQHDDSSSS